MMIHVGYKNYVNTDKILAVTGATAAPLIRQKRRSDKAGETIDCTNNKKTRSLIFLEGGYLATSSQHSQTVSENINKARRVNHGED